jgi:hypothetical protein
MTNEKWQRGVGTGIGLSNHVNTYRCADDPPDSMTLDAFGNLPLRIALSRP